MVEVKVFHYTSFYKALTILGKYSVNQGKPGLKPGKRLGIRPVDLDRPKAVYGLLESVPQSWTNNADFPETWNRLKGDLMLPDAGGLLLEAVIDTESTRAFVGDRAHIEKFLYVAPEDRSDSGVIKAKFEAEEAFAQSMIPLEDYVKEGMQIHSLPEVVILDHLSADRISVSPAQPLVEELLADTHGYFRNQYLDLITGGYFPELSAWLSEYEEKHGPIGEGPRPMRERV